MHRFALLTGALLAGGAAFGQDSVAGLEPTTDFQYAGVYHVATGILDPAAGGPSFFVAPGYIYDNTCPTPSFFGMANGTIAIDEGRIPSASSPGPNTGSVNSYFVDNLEVRYCVRDATGVVTMNLFFWQNYDDCATVAAAGVPTAAYTLAGIPGSTGFPTLACYILTIDLTGVEFNLLGDADGAYTTGSNLDEGFGYGLQLTGQTGTTTGQVGGWVVAGDVTAPGNCANGDRTYYKNPAALNGTGLDNDNLWYNQGAGFQVASTGCLFFGAPPTIHGGFHMRMRANDVSDCNGNDINDFDDIASGFALDCNGNNQPDSCDIATGVSTDCDGNGVPDECDPDCNGNGIPDACDIAGGFSQDCNLNGVPDDCDIAGGFSVDSNANGIPDECEADCNGNGIPDSTDLANGTSQDCNGNGVPDECDIAGGTSTDVDGNGIPDECQPDCNGNGIPDSFDISSGTSTDCNTNGIPDECEGPDCNGNGLPDSCDLASGFSQDCNGNGIPDECDIAGGTSTDFDGNGVPDDCQADCNGNGVPDSYDISQGTSQDCNGNGLPDECEMIDCNGNGVLDSCDIAGGFSNDADSNGIPDDCQPDCNGNGLPDSYDISQGTSQDCNNNGVPDECDITSGFSTDFNANGVPDECESSGSLPYCFGDGSGLNCRCGNNAAPGEGCQNSTGVGGIAIKVGGNSVLADNTQIVAYQLPADNFGIVYMGSNQINGGNGRILGDGIKCAGGLFKRFPLTNADGNGVLIQSNVRSLSGAMITAGSTWNFQCWYRDGNGPCGIGTNLTNAVAVTFTP